MGKIFEYSRLRLLSSNRFYKYLIYASGEIFLVVVGILIAVQINNWNERNKRTKTEIIYLKEIQKSLQTDLNEEILPCIQVYEKANNVYTLLNQNFYNTSKEIDQDSLRIWFPDILSRWKLVLNTVAFDNVESIGIDLISNDTLRMRISNMYGFNYKHLAELQSISNKINHEQTMPTIAELQVEWSRNKVKTAKDLERIKSNTHLQAVLNNSNFLMKQELFFLEQYSPVVSKLIEDIAKEIERLEQK